MKTLALISTIIYIAYGACVWFGFNSDEGYYARCHEGRETARVSCSIASVATFSAYQPQGSTFRFSDWHRGFRSPKALGFVPTLAVVAVTGIWASLLIAMLGLRLYAQITTGAESAARRLSR